MRFILILDLTKAGRVYTVVYMYGNVATPLQDRLQPPRHGLHQVF